MVFRYLCYLIKHKWYVMIECFKMGLIWRGLVHDLSKFLPDEFLPYMNWFYGKYGIKFSQKQPLIVNGCKVRNYDKHKKVEEQFNVAWLKHQHRNKHHYQYWYLRNDDGSEKYIKISDKYKREMICDWIGAGRAITGKNNIKEWWSKTKEKKKMNDLTYIEIDNAIRRMP